MNWCFFRGAKREAESDIRFLNLDLSRGGFPFLYCSRAESFGLDGLKLRKGDVQGRICVASPGSLVVSRPPFSRYPLGHLRPPQKKSPAVKIRGLCDSAPSPEKIRGSEARSLRLRSCSGLTSQGCPSSSRTGAANAPRNPTGPCRPAQRGHGLGGSRALLTPGLDGTRMGPKWAATQSSP